MKRIFLILFTLLQLIDFQAYAKTSLFELVSQEKMNKKEIKEFKLKHNLKSLKIKYREDGTFYYLAERRQNSSSFYGIVDSNRNFILECDYTSIEYIRGIPSSQIKSYEIYNMQGQIETFNIVANPMPSYFLLKKYNEIIITTLQGEIIKDKIYGKPLILGSWMFTNVNKFYTRDLNTKQTLMLINLETKDIGLYTWDGEKLFDNDHFMLTVRGKVNGEYNITYAYDNDSKMGGTFLEKSEIIVPTEYIEMRPNKEDMTFSVKLSPTDNFHLFSPKVEEKFIAKNEGEEFYSKNKYKECIEYYSKHGVNDADSKLYSASSMLNIGLTQALKLSNHIQNPKNKLGDFNYDETKALLTNSIDILEAASLQDSSRINVYKETIETAQFYLSNLENDYAKKQENSFWNQLQKSVLTGLANGIRDAAINSVQHLTSELTSTSSTTKATNKQTSKPTNGTTSSNEEKSNELSSGVQDRIRQLERDIKNQTTYLEHAQKRYESNPTAVAKREIESHKRAIEGYKKQINDLKSGR